MALFVGACIMVTVGAVLKNMEDGRCGMAVLCSILILCSLSVFALFLALYNPVAGGGGI